MNGEFTSYVSEQIGYFTTKQTLNSIDNECRIYVIWGKTNLLFCQIPINNERTVYIIYVSEQIGMLRHDDVRRLERENLLFSSYTKFPLTMNGEFTSYGCDFSIQSD